MFLRQSSFWTLRGNFLRRHPFWRESMTSCCCQLIQPPKATWIRNLIPIAELGRVATVPKPELCRPVAPLGPCPYRRNRISGEYRMYRNSSPERSQETRCLLGSRSSACRNPVHLSLDTKQGLGSPCLFSDLRLSFVTGKQCRPCSTSSRRDRHSGSPSLWPRADGRSKDYPMDRQVRPHH